MDSKGSLSVFLSSPCGFIATISAPSAAAAAVALVSFCCCPLFVAFFLFFLAFFSAAANSCGSDGDVSGRTEMEMMEIEQCENEKPTHMIKRKQ